MTNLEFWILVVTAVSFLFLAIIIPLSKMLNLALLYGGGICFAVASFYVPNSNPYSKLIGMAAVFCVFAFGLAILASLVRKRGDPFWLGLISTGIVAFIFITNTFLLK